MGLLVQTLASENAMKATFKSEQEALDYRDKHQLVGREARPIMGTNKWALIFPLKAHVTVQQPHCNDETTPGAAKSKP